MFINPSNPEFSCNANTIMTESVSVPFTENSNNNNKKKEIKMADIITGTTTGFVNNTPDVTLKELTDTHSEVLREGQAAIAATKAESIPPESPRITLLKLFFST